VSELLNAALRCAARGWPVLPVKARGKVPLTEHGLHDASLDPAQVKEWWGRWPRSNVGLRTGAAFDVLDIDIAGVDVMLALTEEHGTWSRSGPYVRTGSGGRHIYFAPTTRRVGNRARFVEGCDWRGKGGYVIAPPSAHRSGEWYEWLRGPDRSLPEMPPWLLDLLDPPRPSMPVRRAVTRGSRYAETVFDAEVSIVQDAPVGTRNDTLNRAAFNIGTLVGAGLLDEAEVEDSLVQAARQAGVTEREARQTTRSGLRGGASHPREVAS